MKIFVLLCLAVACAQATVYFSEDFGDGWESRWVVSKFKSEAERGDFAHTAGKYFNDAQNDKGIQTSEDSRFYQISAKFPKVFNNKDKTLVVQYRMKNEQDLDCGGGYLKLMPSGLDQEKFEGESAYNIMFGPDKCGGDRKVHAILNYKGKNHLIKKNVLPEGDRLSHIYTFVLKPDQTYEIWVDGDVKQSGSVEADWDVLPAKEIPDPAVSKPADWVDEAQIDDPSAVKPEGWDDIPKEIADPSATKPDDWDDELDGEWEAPFIPNPEYKGEWRAPRIANPAYKGEWVHPKIANPDYHPDDSITDYESEYLGFEIWQVKSGTLFDNILVTDDVNEARAFIDGPFAELKKGEKAAFEEYEKSQHPPAPAADQEDGDDDDEHGDHEDHEDHEHVDL